MLTISRPKRRFSYLLLEEDEYLFQSHRAMIDRSYLDEMSTVRTATDAVAADNATGIGIPERRFFVEGKLHICSNGLIFEPLNHPLPVIRLSFKKMGRLQAWRPSAEQCEFFETQLQDHDELENSAGNSKHKVSWSSWAKSGTQKLTSWLSGGGNGSNGGSASVEESRFEFIECYVSKVLDIGRIGEYRPYIKRKISLPCSFALEQIPGKQHSVLTRINQLLLLTQMRSYYRAQNEDEEPRLKMDALINEHERELMAELHKHCKPASGEKILVESKVHKVKPLMNIPGRFVLTQSAIYFWKFHVYPPKCQTFHLSNVFQVKRRRFMLRHTAIEITLKSHRSYLFNFDSTATVDVVWSYLIKREGLSTQDVKDWRKIVKQWQLGNVSNFHYLLYLNSMADRSFNDLTQYPVFPWVIADYFSPKLDLHSTSTFRNLSVPMGAVNPDRLAMFKSRMKEMSEDDPQFLYGSHYSTPAYTLFYLIRSAPEYSLKLQSGKFDYPDRIFHSIATTFRTCCQNPADVKELIPEFYQPPGTFLVNHLKLEFGPRSDNTQGIGDVVLPPWATDARDFTNKCREALECQYVSDNIHHWIDLIFGFKQRGDAAAASDNVFHPFTYEGSVDVDKIEDVRQRLAIQAQINEFGQTPRQLFLQPHPTRRKLKIPRSPSANSNGEDDTLESPQKQHQQHQQQHQQQQHQQRQRTRNSDWAAALKSSPAK